MKVHFLAALVGLSILTGWAQGQSGPPAICKPCLFYGGDLNPTDPSAEAFLNEETINADAETYGAITIPKNHAVLVEGILFQIIIEDGERLDPKSATYEIRTDITDGGGTLIAAGGSPPVYMQPTGRQFNGNLEYTIAVRVNPPVQLDGGTKHPGTAYWFNLVPYCTNHGDPTCKTVQYFVSNTTQQTNGVRPFAQDFDGVVLVWPQFPAFSLCDQDGFTGQQCIALSFGLMGTVVQ